MVFTNIQHRFVGQTAARLRINVTWLYQSTPQLTSLQQQVIVANESPCHEYRVLKAYAVQFGRKSSSASQPGFTWGHKLPARVQTAAGIAAEVEHEKVQQQRNQESSLPESLMLRSAPGSSSQKQHTGAFARLPMVPLSTEIVESALKRAGRVAANKKLKNEAQKARSRYNPQPHDLHASLIASVLVCNGTPGQHLTAWLKTLCVSCSV